MATGMTYSTYRAWHTHTTYEYNPKHEQPNAKFQDDHRHTTAMHTWPVGMHAMPSEPCGKGDFPRLAMRERAILLRCGPERTSNPAAVWP